jgi:adenylate cyclase
VGYFKLHQLKGGRSDEGRAAAERALALEPELAEAHAIKAQILLQDGEADAAAAEVAIALKLDPDSYETNRSAARLSYQLHRHEDAIRYYEKAVKLMDADVNSAMMLISCYAAIGDLVGKHRAAELALKRTESVLAQDQYNSGVTAYSAYALAALGEGERAKARMERTLLIDPENFNTRYNFACALSVHLKDKQAALDMLESAFAMVSEVFLPYAKADPDLEFLRDDPRYQAMVAAAEARLGVTTEPVRAQA